MTPPAQRRAGDCIDNSTGAPRTALGQWIRRLEITLLALIFVAIVIIGLTQIGLRNFAESSLAWADAAMRAGVLWITMLAGVLAAGSAQHIRIEVLGRYLPDHARAWVERMLYALTALVCLTLAVASVDLVRLEFSINDLAFLAVPRWVVTMIIPVGFVLMGWRFMRIALAPRPGSGKRS